MERELEATIELEVAAMYKHVISSDLPKDEKKKLLNDIRKIMPVGQNRWTIRGIILALSIVGITAPTIFLLPFVVALFRGGAAGVSSDMIPDSVIALSSAAIGALSTYMTSLAQR